MKSATIIVCVAIGSSAHAQTSAPTNSKPLSTSLGVMELIPWRRRLRSRRQLPLKLPQSNQVGSDCVGLRAAQPPVQ
jgi:hypothetical protein